MSKGRRGQRGTKASDKMRKLKGHYTPPSKKEPTQAEQLIALFSIPSNTQSEKRKFEKLPLPEHGHG